MAHAVRGVNASVLKYVGTAGSRLPLLHALAHSPVAASLDTLVPETSDLLSFDLTVTAPGNADLLQVALGDEVIGEIDLTDFSGLGTAHFEFPIGKHVGENTPLRFVMPSDVPSNAEFLLANVEFVSLNDPPTADAIAVQTIAAGNLLSLTVTGHDPAGNGITYSLFDDAPAAAAIDPVTGLFQWTPAAAQAPGQYVVTVRLTDDGPGTLSSYVPITVAVDAANHAPTVAVPFNGVAVDEDAEPTVLELSGVFDDVDIPAGGDALTLALAGNSNPTLVTATLEGASLRLVYAANQSGQATITVRATDRAGAFVETSVQVAVAAVNDLPTRKRELSEVVVPEGTQQTVMDLSALFDDTDTATNGDRLTLSVAGNTRPDLVSASLNDTQLRLDFAPGQYGTTITVRGTDTAGAFAEATLHIVVQPEFIVTAAGAGGGPHVRVFSGADGLELQGFMAYDPRFTGGVYVAAGDFDLDGRADIVTAAGAGGGPHVRVFSGKDQHEIAGLMAYDPQFSGGVYVAGNLPPTVAALRADTASGGDASDVAVLTDAQAQAFTAAALARLQAAGLPTERVPALRTIAVQVADLPGDLSGQSLPGAIVLDATAAGSGWFLDLTPLDDAEFQPLGNVLTLTATTVERSHMDLLSVLLHELGHQLGEDHADAADDWMGATLPAGIRRLPRPEELDQTFSDAAFQEWLLVGG